MTAPDPANERWKAGLLASAAEDGPAPGALDRELARLGLAAGAAAIAAGAAGSTAPGAMAGAGAGAGAGAAKLGAAATVAAGLSVTKIAILATIVIATASSWVALREPAAVEATGNANANANASAEVREERAVVVAPAQAPRVERRAPVERGESAPAPRLESPPVVVAERGPSVAAEVALVDRARGLARARPNEAIALLDEHRTTFPAGVLHDEAAVVRLEALLAAGRRAEAERHAQPFVRDRAGAPIARRMSALLGPSNPSIP